MTFAPKRHPRAEILGRGVQAPQGKHPLAFVSAVCGTWWTSCLEYALGRIVGLVGG